MMPLIANLGSPTHWAILFILVLLVFGAKRLPEIARNLGKGLAEFKKAKREFEEELNKVDDKKTESSEKKSENE